MMKSINGTIKKRRGRPATGAGTSINVRLHSDALDRLDAWIATQDDKPSRPEALRRLFELGVDKTIVTKDKPVTAPTKPTSAAQRARVTKAIPIKKTRPRRP
jgi:hypothetical protein